jgi:uroporphyrinogen III methyltransferase/synthase
MRVLITRPEGDAGPLRTLLEERGFEVVMLPTTTVQPVEDDSELADALAQLEDHDWMVFTSRNAVDAVMRTMRSRECEIPPGLLIAAVGSRTEGVLRQAGMRVACVPQEATGEALAHALIQRGVRGSRILLPAGDRARPQLAEILRQAGAEVRVVTAYRTVMAPAGKAYPALKALRSGSINAVALASPSAFEGLLALLGPDARSLGRVGLVCIGPTTASAVRDAGFTPAVVAEPHTLEGLVGAVSNLDSMETSHE